MVRIQLLKCRHLVSSERPQGVQDISLGPVGISQVLLEWEQRARLCCGTFHVVIRMTLPLLTATQEGMLTLC